MDKKEYSFIIELDERIHDLIKLSEEIGGKSELYKRI